MSSFPTHATLLIPEAQNQSLTTNVHYIEQGSIVHVSVITMLRLVRSGAVWSNRVCWVKGVNNPRYAVSFIYVLWLIINQIKCSYNFQCRGGPRWM